MKQKILFTVLCLGLLTFYYSCNKDHINETYTQEKYNTVSIETAKEFFNSNNSSLGFRNSQTIQTSVTHWEASKNKKYKNTDLQDVDILYTPIYLKTDANAKAFIATTEHGGIVDSRKIYVLYKDNSLENGLSAYVVIFRLTGEMQFFLNYQNGQLINSSTQTSNTLNRMDSDCDGDLTDMSDEDFEQWLADCAYGVLLDTSVVTATLSNSSGANGGSSTAFNDWNSSQWVSGNIPAIINPSDSNNTGGGSNSNIDVNWHVPNVTIATPASIALVLNAPFSSAIANWLRNQSQQTLNQIADYLNENRVQNPFSDFTFGDIQPEQFPVSDEAIEFIIDFINLANNNTSTNGWDLNDLSDCVAEGNTLEECVFEETLDEFFNGMDKDCQALEIIRSIYRIRANSTFANNIWNHFFVSSTNNINVQDLGTGEVSDENDPNAEGPMPADIAGRTLPVLGGDDNNTVIIQLHHNILDNATTLGYVITFYHELLHAYILSLYYNGTLLTEHPSYINLKTALDNYLADTDNQVLFDVFDVEMHNIYLDFIDQLAEVIVAYCNYNNISGIDLNYAKSLVWGSLIGYDVFTNNLTEAEQAEAQTKIVYENTNHNNAKGTKTCD